MNPRPGRAVHRWGTGSRRTAARLLRVPLLHKIVIANAALVAGCALLTARLAAGWPYGDPAAAGLVLGFGVVAVSLTVAINAVLVAVALHPLRLLREAADRIRAGEWDEGAPDSPLADRDMEGLRSAINAMVDRLHGYRARLSVVTGRALEAADEERRRISRDLHDDTLQRLAALIVLVRRARSCADTEARDALLDEVRARLTATADDLRRMAHALRPPVVEELGLRPAIEAHVRSVGERGGVRPTLQVRGDGRLAPEAEVAVYRIVQEALANAECHGHAGRIAVRVDLAGGGAVAAIEDDGVGFDAQRVFSDPRTGRGLGLVGMRERAEQAGGHLSIESAPGRGTRVTVRVPAAG